MTWEEKSDLLNELLEYEENNDIGNLTRAERRDFQQWISKALEQEPCEDCDYSEIVDWEQDAKTGKSKPIYWCEKHKEPCEDTVSRQAVLDVIKSMSNANPSYWNKCDVVDREDLIDEISELPSVKPHEPKTGHWIRHDNGKYHWYLCSFCDAMAGSDEKMMAYKYCPNCGAKMESEV